MQEVHAVYDVGKTLVAGEWRVIEGRARDRANGATPVVSATSAMAFGRRQHNLTLLADEACWRQAAARPGRGSST